MKENEMHQEDMSIRNDPYYYMVNLCFNRWKPYLIRAIQFDGGTRFSRFTKQLPISEKVLTSNLRELENDGVIVRTVYPEVPPRVEYHLTEIGKDICGLLDQVYSKGREIMLKKGLPIDKLGEMWHGYQERDEAMMKHPYKK